MTGAYGPPDPQFSGQEPLLTVLTAVAVGAVVVTVSLAGDEVSVPISYGTETDAVTAALRQLDPCRLLDLAVARQRQVPNAVLVPTGPRTCTLAVSTDPLVVRSGMALSVGMFSDQFRRFDGAALTLGGAKMYEFAGSSGGFDVPRGHPGELRSGSPAFHHSNGSGHPCPTVRAYAEAKLRDPDMTEPGLSAGDLLSCCRANDATLMIRYGKQRHLEGEKSLQISGKTALVSGNKPCTTTWDQGSSGSSMADYGTVSVELSGKDCATATAMTEQAIGLAGERPDDVEPLRPLLFGSDDNDTGALGARVDFGVTGGQEGCEPYQEVAVPKAPDDILAASRSDRNVQCAVFLDAVREAFGAQFAPEKAEFAGKPTVTFWDVNRTSFDVYLSPSGDLDRRGNLHLGLTPRGGRGKEIGGSPPLSEDNSGRATAAMTRAVETYFH